jgi:hypothetical protein
MAPSLGDAHRLPLRISLIIALFFLSIPYLVDVGYLGDATPTHAAQEISTDYNKESFDDILATFANVTATVALEEQETLPSPLSGSESDSDDTPLAPYGYLSVASLISRPPPGI